MNILLWVLQVRRAHVRSVGRHEGLHVRQDKRAALRSICRKQPRFC